MAVSCEFHHSGLVKKFRVYSELVGLCRSLRKSGSIGGFMHMFLIWYCK